MNPNKWKLGSLEQKGFAGPCEKASGSCSKSPELSEGFWQSTANSQVSEGVTGSCDPLVHVSDQLARH